MANQSAKKQLKDNQSLIQDLIKYSIGANVAYILIRIIWFFNSFSFFLGVGFVLLLGTYALAFWHIMACATATYDNGELIDGGSNIRQTCESVTSQFSFPSSFPY
eukprot:TRINITY_DN8252_c0_g1_i1.p2 TRINITY_DN8252_c0_g1~~TRINITY_DN8252_c0_g1_i1.p2  ORF type:complete len:105 (-),score=20.73 TRINITY_DN8252_c0_g1_i1:569-883(-)